MECGIEVSSLRVIVFGGILCVPCEVLVKLCRIMQGMGSLRLVSPWCERVSLLGPGPDSTPDWFNEIIDRVTQNGLRIFFWDDT